jgi:hypothetical protein
MNAVIAFFKKFFFAKSDFYYYREELQFEKQAEDARNSYLVSSRKAS